ncbi:MAG: septal ring lytic transglycosylase RlpA family protein [Chitinophagaceae bacterium]|nr:MAG: septal ring lytic transglycosylase RlpA family protein [Chitinophagaceae bacterium]
MKTLRAILFFFVMLLNVQLVAQDSLLLPPKKDTLYGIASYYHDKFEGRKTANGEIFSQNKMTAACNIIPLGTMVRVTNIRNQRAVIVKINDRLHPKMTRIVDLSFAAAKKLGFIRSGLTRVMVEILEKDD